MMEKKEVLFVKTSNKVIEDGGARLHVQYVGVRETKVATIKVDGYSKKVEIGAYGLRAEVYNEVGTHMAFVTKIDFGAVFPRIANIDGFIKEMSRKEITTLHELLTTVGKRAQELKQTHNEQFKKDALRQLQREMAEVNYASTMQDFLLEGAGVR